MCATLINHGERLIVPSGHYMHSPIDAVNELPVLTYKCNYSVTKSAPSWPGGLALGARWCFTGWYTTHGTGWEVGGGECARARACLWGCACVRETVCAITFVSVFLDCCSS